MILMLGKSYRISWADGVVTCPLSVGAVTVVDGSLWPVTGGPVDVEQVPRLRGGVPLGRQSTRGRPVQELPLPQSSVLLRWRRACKWAVQLHLSVQTILKCCDMSVFIMRHQTCHLYVLKIILMNDIFECLFEYTFLFTLMISVLWKPKTLHILSYLGQQRHSDWYIFNA